VADFVIYRGDSLVATEHLVRYSDRIEGTVELMGQARASYTATLGPGRSIRRIESHVAPWSGENEGNALSADFVGDSIFIERTLPLPSATRRGGGPMPIPYLHPSPGLLERIVMRGIEIGGDPSEVPIWYVTPNAARLARVHRISTRVVDVEMAGGRIRVWLDEFGLVMAEVPSLGWLIQRRDR
jgi:hypothetical protein